MPVNDSCAVADIIVRDRARKSIGNILGLCESIGRLGLLHPLVLNGRRELIAGGRRLAAVKRLGWETVPVRVVESLDDAVAAMQAERDENNCREDLTPTEIVEIGRAIEALEKPKAKERLKDAGRAGGKASGKLPEASTGDTRDKVGAALGVSGKTYEKAKQVVEAAEAEPEKFGDLPAKMDAESVHAAHDELKQRQEPETKPEPDVAPAPEPVDAGAEFVARINKLCSALDAAKKEAGELSSVPVFGGHVHKESVTGSIEAARKALWQSRPTEACNCVRGGAPAKAECKACFGAGVTIASRVRKGGK